MTFPPGDNNPIDIYPIKSPLTGAELFEIANQGTGKLYGQVSDITMNGIGPMPVNVVLYGADKTGATDSAAAFRSAIAYASSFTPHMKLYIPSGYYKIGSTVTIPSAFTVLGDGPMNSVLIPTMTDGTACLKFVSSNENITLEDFGISTGDDFALFRAGRPAPNCIGIEAADISLGHTTRYYFSNIKIDGCRTGMKIDGWIGTVNKLFITSCDLGFDGHELNGVMLNLICENCRLSWQIIDSFALTMMTLQDEGDVQGQLASRLNSSHGVTFYNPYWEAGLTYPRTVPYLTIGDFYICQAVSIHGALMETINLPRTVPPVDVIWLDGGYIETYLSVGSAGSGIGIGPRLGSGAYNVRLKQANGIQTYAYQDFSMASSPNYNYFPNPFFEAWLKGWSAINLSNATLAQDLWTVRRGHYAVKATATAGFSNNYIEFILPTLKLPFVSMFAMTYRVGAWIWIPDIAAYNDGTLAKIPDISIGWTDTLSVFRESTTTHPGTLATGTWSYVYALITPLDTVTKIHVRVYPNRTANNANGTELIYVDSITIMHASVPLERQKDETFHNCEYLPTFEAGGQMRMLGNAVPTDVNQTYSRGDQFLIQEPNSYSSPGWICTGAGAGGTATWSELPAMTGHGLVANTPALAGTFAGARYYATDGRNSGEGAGAGTGCWCTMRTNGGWYADWSGLIVTN
jgi:hypothetical protein